MRFGSKEFGFVPQLFVEDHEEVHLLVRSFKKNDAKQVFIDLGCFDDYPNHVT